MVLPQHLLLLKQQTLVVSQSTSFSLQAVRKPFISGNWKLNPQSKDEAVALAADIAAAIGPDTPDADVALFVPVSTCK